MKKIILILFAVMYLGIVKADAANKNLFYIIPKGTTVLAFIGDPHSLNVKPIRLTSYEDQNILIFHRKSGPGIWAFYLKGFSHLTSNGTKTIIPNDGYFMVSKRKIRR
jgi:hypothetical protein